MLTTHHGAFHTESTEYVLTSIIFWQASKNLSINEKATLLEHALSQITVGRLQISVTELCFLFPLKNIFKISHNLHFKNLL